MLLPVDLSAPDILYHLIREYSFCSKDVKNTVNVISQSTV